MLRELRVSEMRYRAVLEVLDGAVISTVARRYGVSRQTVHAWPPSRRCEMLPEPFRLRFFGAIRQRLRSVRTRSHPAIAEQFDGTGQFAPT
jgi:hypothetical protein